MHVSIALIKHLFAREMSWGSTSKSVKSSPLVQEAPMILRKYRTVFAICLVLLAVMVVLGIAVPEPYRINSFLALLPIAWMLSFSLFNPFLLNAQSYLAELFSYL